MYLKPKTVKFYISFLIPNHHLLISSITSNLQSHKLLFNRHHTTLDQQPQSSQLNNLLTHPSQSIQSQCQAINPSHQIVNQSISSSNSISQAFIKQKCFPDPLNSTLEEYCIYSNQAFNHPFGISILSTPSRFHQTINQSQIFLNRTDDNLAQNIQSPYELVNIPEKFGVGLVATRQLGFGHQIMVSHPLLLIHLDRLTWSDDDWGRVLLEMVNGLPHAGHLAISHRFGMGETSEEWLRSVFDLNSFDMSLDEKLPIQALIPDASAFNHDCRPNVAYQFDLETLQIKAYAVREIQAGEELTISYHGFYASWEERQVGLWRGYGFECKCDHCSLSSTERYQSDQRVQLIANLFEELLDWSQDSKANEEMAENLIKAFRDENMYPELEMVYLLASREYNGSGNIEQAKAYALLAITHAAIGRGEGWSYRQEVQTLAHHPEQHWTYKKRLSITPLDSHA